MVGDGRQDDDGARRVRPLRGRVAHAVRMLVVFVVLQALLAVVLPVTLGAARSLAVFWAIAVGAFVALVVDEARRLVLPTPGAPTDEIDLRDAA